MFNSHSQKRSSKVMYTVAQEEPVAVSTARKKRNRANLCYTAGARIPARLVLYFLSCSGFLVSFMMRNDINFALVAMTRPSGSVMEMAPNTTNTDSNYTSSVLYHDKGTILHENATEEMQLITNTTITQLATHLLQNTTNAVIAPKQDHYYNDMYQYDWSSTVTSVIVSSFYWWYVLSQVVGGIVTQYFGTKHVFGWSQFATALCSLCIPFAADFHYAAVIVLRSVQGFASGLTWPAMYAIVGYWIPFSERSRFMSSFQGFSIGIGLTYPLCGFLIDNYGWRYVFYTTGSLGMIWCVLWYLLAFNTPKQHPRISAEELMYIEENIGAGMSDSLGMKVPWKNIFTSVPAWAIGITTFGRIWIHYIFIVSGPNFMKYMLKFEYKVNGFLSGMPFIMSYVSSVFFCYAADKIIQQEWLSLTNVRKIFTALSQVVPGLLIYWIGYIEYDITLLIVIWFLAVTFITASYAGAMANIVDIAPNFAGPVLAFCQTIHMSASFLSPLVSGIIVTDKKSIEQWRTVFGTSTVITILTCIVFLVYGTADVQKWNYLQTKNTGDGSSEESQILKKPTVEAIPKDEVQ